MRMTSGERRSREGERIVTGSGQYGAVVDPETGKQIGEPLTGHSPIAFIGGLICCGARFVLP
jgi:hypothetical protein